MVTAVIRVSKFTGNSCIFCYLIFNNIKWTYSAKSLMHRDQLLKFKAVLQCSWNESAMYNYPGTYLAPKTRTLLPSYPTASIRVALSGYEALVKALSLLPVPAIVMFTNALPA